MAITSVMKYYAFGHYDTPLLAGGHHIYQGPTRVVGARLTYDF